MSILRVPLGQLRFRRARAIALTLVLLAASAGFLLLSAAGKTTDVRVKGSVRSAFRPAYDILVRPRGSATPLERSAGLVRSNYLSGIYGGITLKQWQAIERIHGVAVAAPVANIGYVLPEQVVKVGIKRDLTKDPVQLYRITSSWRSNAGDRYPPDHTYYVYYTRLGRFVSVTRLGIMAQPAPGDTGYTLPCGGFDVNFFKGASGPFDPYFRASIECFAEGQKANSLTWAALPRDPAYADFVGGKTWAAFPVALSAVDPVSEAKLVRLDRTIVGGRYLRPGDAIFHQRARRSRFVNPIAGQSRRPPASRPLVPVIASSRNYQGEELELEIERLRVPRGTNVPRALSTGACMQNSYPCQARFAPPRGASYATGRQFTEGLKGTVIETRTLPIAPFYQRLFTTASPVGSGLLGSVGVWSASPVRYRVVARDHVAAIPTHNPGSIWQDNTSLSGFLSAPTDNEDLQFRRLRQRAKINPSGAAINDNPQMKIVGRFDPRKLPGFSPLSRVPLETYYPPILKPADAASRKALRGHDYLPTQNLGGYVAQPPLLLTTIQALRRYFFNPKYFEGVPKSLQRAPIGVIRIRVAGVRGPDRISIARIKAVASAIHDRTGLQVDITAGSSPHPLLVSLPKGKFGSPPLFLREGWSKKGVSISFLNALDHKRLGFLLLILATSAFVVANGAFAIVRQRRREIGTLLSLGWTQRQIFVAVLAELVVIGLAAGLLGAGLAALVSAASSLTLSWWQVLLVVPLALLLALLAGLLPAWRASRLLPLDAVRPAISGEPEGRRVHTLLALALANLRRVPARSLIAASGLTVGVAALTLLVGINQSFQGTLVGTLLGSAISLQVTGLDFLAVGLIVALSALALADVLYVNLRERQAELVTLKTFGWSDRHLQELVALEATLLGLVGSLTGALVGIVLGALVGLPLGSLLVAAVIACLGGLVVALAACLFPTSRIARYAVPTVLAADE
jgi:putative ABC transport system permease protein